MNDQGERGGRRPRRSNRAKRNSNAGKVPNRKDDSNIHNPLNNRLINVSGYEDVDVNSVQKDGSLGKFFQRCTTEGKEMSPCDVLDSVRQNTSNGNAEISQRQNVRFVQVNESDRHLPDNAFNFSCSPTTCMSISTGMQMCGHSNNHLNILESDVPSPMFDDILIDDVYDVEGRYLRLGSPGPGTSRFCFQEAATPGRSCPNTDMALDGQDENGSTRGNVPSRKKRKGGRTLFRSFCRTMNLLLNQVLSKSFQTMISYIITTSFFIFLNLYVSNSCTYEEIGGFGVAVSVITLLNTVVDGVCNSLDYFCSYSIAMANTDLSLLYLNIAYYTFYLFFAKVMVVFLLTKIVILLFLNSLYVDPSSNVGDASKHPGHLQMIHVFCSSLQILLVSFFPQFIYESTRRYLILHNYIYPSLFTSFVSFILLNFFCYVFVFSLGMKYVGACVALLLTNVFNFCCVLYFLRIHLARCVSSTSGGHQLASCVEDLLLSGDHYVEVGEEQLADRALGEDVGEGSGEDVGEDIGEGSGEDIREDTGEDDTNDETCDDTNCETCEDPNHSVDRADRRIANLTFLFFHKPPDDEQKKGFVKTARTNIKNIFFEVLSFEFQLFEATYLSLTSVATYVQINNILNLVYYVSNSYGIILSKLISIYSSSRAAKGRNRRGTQRGMDRQNGLDGRRHRFVPELLLSGGRGGISVSQWGKLDTQNRILPELKSQRNGSKRHRRSRISLLDIVLAFLFMLTFLSLFLVAAYLFRDQIIPFVFTDINIQNELKGIIFVLVVELFLEVLASLLNSIIKGLSLQEEISFFTFFNFLFFMHPLGLLLTFILQLDIYGFVYSNLASMAVQVAYLLVFLAFRAQRGLGR
ncbi:hypothetical protein AK88_04862 [Plasmodium fragile]|uniref:Uncharacterized protein n=1 Tax=Plasmodium fragile TaxID=5857 RepID=A0A0D9QIF7_PLAFR|nr:uncharacterized protein AK88_04862 [Plasmodium fragile]KJP85511.1 hypothetical protein AK88_04862 [Plasmodium fragile]